MIVALLVLGGLAGATAGLLIAGVWSGAALVFGLPGPSTDQIHGLVAAFGSLGAIFAGTIAGLVLLWDGERP